MYKKFSKLASYSIILSTISVGSALADPASVARSCAAGVDCASVVGEEISSLGGTGASKDAAIVEIVVALGDEAQILARDKKRCERIALGVLTAAESISDAEQAERIRVYGDGMCSNTTIATAALDEDVNAGLGGGNASPN